MQSMTDSYLDNMTVFHEHPLKSNCVRQTDVEEITLSARSTFSSSFDPRQLKVTFSMSPSSSPHYFASK